MFQVGSILEYRYVLATKHLGRFRPLVLQGPLYIRKAHFQFIPSDRFLEDGMWRDAGPRGLRRPFLPGRVGLLLPAGKSIASS